MQTLSFGAAFFAFIVQKICTACKRIPTKICYNIITPARKDDLMNTKAYIEEITGGMCLIPIESRFLTDRCIFLDEPITVETSVSFAKAMLWLMKSPEPITICISCSGGEVNAGLAIYDLIQSCPNKIYMYCIGQACSMAAVLLAAGQKGRRFILPHSSVMIHEVLLSSGISGSATSISRISDSIIETRNLVNGILAKHTGKSIEEILRATSFDNFLNAKEAVEFGICDEIVEKVQINEV